MLTSTILMLPAFGQFRENTTPELTCSMNQRGRQEYAQICDMREMRVPVTQRLDIDPGANGSISVKGWNRPEVWVRARLDAGAKAGETAARDLAAQVRIETTGGRIAASGPQRDQAAWWGVTFEIFAPHKIDLAASTKNGCVSFSDMEGRITFTTVNGGVTLARLAGDVSGRTTNGGVSVDLDGNRWNGVGLDVATSNGGVTLAVPAAYSADLQTGTTNGGFTSDFGGVTDRQQNNRGARKQLELILGNGGAPVRVKTVNGGVRIRRK